MSGTDRYLCSLHAKSLNDHARLSSEALAIRATPFSEWPFVTRRCEQYVRPVLATGINTCEFARPPASGQVCDAVYRWQVEDVDIVLSNSQAARDAIRARAQEASS